MIMATPLLLRYLPRRRHHGDHGIGLGHDRAVARYVPGYTLGPSRSLIRLLTPVRLGPGGHFLEVAATATTCRRGQASWTSSPRRPPRWAPCWPATAGGPGRADTGWSTLAGPTWPGRHWPGRHWPGRHWPGRRGVANVQRGRFGCPRDQQCTDHRFDAAGRLARDAAPVHRGAGTRGGLRSRRCRGGGHRGLPRRRLGGSSFNYGFSGTDEIALDPRGGGRGGHGPGRGPAAARGGRRPRICARRTTRARPSARIATRLRGGGRVHPALRGRPRAGHGDGRLPDARAPARPGRAGPAGPDHGGRGRRMRLRGRLGRGDGAGRRRRGSRRW